MSHQNNFTCLIIGGRGFVGSALTEAAIKLGWGVMVAGRQEYHEHVGRHFNLVVNASGNASRFRANQEPLFDLEASVLSVQRTLIDFKFDHYALVSSVDVYNSLTTLDATSEDADIDLASLCTYGFHKRIAELLVTRQAESWQVFRLAQMVGPGLKKGPTFDLLNRQPLWVSPDTRLHYLSTRNVARVLFDLIEGAPRNEIYNISGRGNVAMRDVIAMLPEPLQDVEFAGREQQEYQINTDKTNSYCRLPSSKDEIHAFLGSAPACRNVVKE